MSLFQTDDEFLYQPFVDALESASLQIVQSTPPVYESQHKLPDPQNSSLTDISYYNKPNQSSTTRKLIEVLHKGHNKYGKYKPMQWTIEIVEDYCIGYPESHELFKDFNCFLNSWEVFSTKLLKIRRSSIKDKYAINLLSNLDSAELNGKSVGYSRRY